MERHETILIPMTPVAIVRSLLAQWEAHPGFSPKIAEGIVIGAESPRSANVSGDEYQIAETVVGLRQVLRAMDAGDPLAGKAGPHRGVALLVDALSEARSHIRSYRDFSEAMRELGRGHVPLTGKHGFGPETLDGYITAALLEGEQLLVTKPVKE